MKRILMAAAVCLVYVLACAGCGGKQNPNADMSASDLQAKQAEAKSRAAQSDAARASSMKGSAPGQKSGR